MATVQERRCPNCHAALSPGRTKCVCGLEVSKWATFAEAKRRAMQKGLRTEVEVAAEPWWRSRVVLGSVIGLAAVVLGVVMIVLWSGSRPEPWEKFPTVREELVREMMGHVEVDTDESLKKAWGLVSPELVKEHGDKYLQLFHEVALYLSGEFGSAWGKGMTITQDAKDENRFAVKVGLETLHVRTVLVTPRDAPAGATKRYAIEGFEEFDVSLAGKMQQMAGITGGLRGLGAGGSADQLTQILGSKTDPNRGSDMDMKRRILPLLRNPRGEGIKYAVLHAWRVRKDPVVRARLEQIVQDGRYEPDIQRTAQSVLDESVTDEELTAAGFNYR